MATGAYWFSSFRHLLILVVLLASSGSSLMLLRPRVWVTPAMPPASGSKSSAASLSTIDKYSNEPPTLPFHGTRSTPLCDLQHWHVEISSARGNCHAAAATKSAAIAAKEAAVVALQLATS